MLTRKNIGRLPALHSLAQDRLELATQVVG